MQIYQKNLEKPIASTRWFDVLLLDFVRGINKKYGEFPDVQRVMYYILEFLEKLGTILMKN